MRDIFKIPKSSGVVMLGNVMQSDGSNERDLGAVNISTMQFFLDTDEKDFDVLLADTLEKIQGIIAGEEQQKIDDEHAVDIQRRSQEINDVVDTILETINNLPMDAQIKIKVALSSIVQDTDKQHETKNFWGKKGKESADK